MIKEVFNVVMKILGLGTFEVVSSIDNAVINAEVLATVSARAKRWFATWGFFIAVVMVRGLLPWFIVYAATPGIGMVDAFMATIRSDPAVASAVKESSPVLLVGGGTFLVLLFFHWLFVEPKTFGLKGERFFSEKAIWFEAVAAVLLAVIVWFAVHRDPMMAFSAAMGSSAFFLTSGFKRKAEEQEKRMLRDRMSDVAKLMYLEVIDGTFSIDGVIGAFAFTLSVPLILFGNGIGAWVIRKLTLSNVERVKRLKYLKNGAMYSIGILGTIMVVESFGAHLPHLTSPILTMFVVGYFFWKSIQELRVEKN